ncbi:MAG: gliding motility-associated C-terminal domain-containing protein, partial [Bacteroidota bacterium]
INLADGLYTVTDKELLTLNGDPLFCTDIAFEPNTELVYGYDASSDRLAIINPLSGIADNTFFPQNDVVANTPSLFFDSFGNLFGLGAGDLQTTDVNLFKFNINTGEAELFAPAEDLNGNSDGCSCPFNLALNQSFNPSTTFSCTRTRLTIRLANLTSSILNNANLSETLDPAFSVEEFIYNPFGGTIESMLGTNEIEISGLNIPIGVDSIVVMVDVGDAPVGLYQQQASLDIINPNLGTIDTTIVSDNPFTPIPNDSSTLEIVPLSVDLSDNPTIFCVGDELVLRATAGLGLEYEWNDDSTAPQLLVDRPDLYSVTVSTACEVASDSINIEQAVIEIDLGEDMSITLGDEVQLNPSIFAFGELVEYIWYQGSPPELIDCPNCTSYSETPLASTSYTLLLRDEYDCEAEDTKNVEVLKDYDLFAPNAFSPNRDGQNDFFYLQTKEVLIIEEFRVFDRWGGLVFEVKDRMTNLPSDGWNGLTGGQAAPEGLYVWTAEVKWIDGVVQAYAGEILLLH